MRAVLLVAASVLALGCGAAVPPLAAPDEGLPLLVLPPAATVSPAPAEVEPEPTPPDPGEATAPCPLKWTPREARAGTFITYPLYVDRRDER